MSDRFQFRDARGLRRSINRASPIVGVHIEASVCHRTGAAGWAMAMDTADGGSRTLSGPVHGVGEYRGTLVELLAVRDALQAALVGLQHNAPLILSMRSTATLAVLRWVFRDAPFTGDIIVQPPKALRRDTQEFDALHDIFNAVEDSGSILTLHCATATPKTEAVALNAREQMELGRNQIRSTRR